LRSRIPQATCLLHSSIRPLLPHSTLSKPPDSAALWTAIDHMLATRTVACCSERPSPRRLYADPNTRNMPVAQCRYGRTEAEKREVEAHSLEPVLRPSTRCHHGSDSSGRPRQARDHHGRQGELLGAKRGICRVVQARRRATASQVGGHGGVGSGYRRSRPGAFPCLLRPLVQRRSSGGTMLPSRSNTGVSKTRVFGTPASGPVPKTQGFVTSDVVSSGRIVSSGAPPLAPATFSLHQRS